MSVVCLYHFWCGVICSRLRVDISTSSKLRMLKCLVNLPVRVLDKILRFPSKPRFQQTRMVLRMYKVLQKTYQIEVSQGIFAKDAGDRRGPIRHNRGDADGNFEQLLSVAAKILAQISERDKYYRQWLGLLFILAAQEMNNIDLPPEQMLAEIGDQWKEDLTFLPAKHLVNHKIDFNEILLTHYLSNVARQAKKRTAK